LKALIGEPEDYNANLGKDNFPTNTNIALPGTTDNVIDDLDGITLGGDKVESKPKSRLPSINAANGQDDN